MSRPSGAAARVEIVPFHGLVMPKQWQDSGGVAGVAALRRSAAAMMRQPRRPRMAMAKLRRLAKDFTPHPLEPYP
jgi:hypothetical protein